MTVNELDGRCVLDVEPCDFDVLSAGPSVASKSTGTDGSALEATLNSLFCDDSSGALPLALVMGGAGLRLGCSGGVPNGMLISPKGGGGSSSSSAAATSRSEEASSNGGLRASLGGCAGGETWVSLRLPGPHSVKGSEVSRGSWRSLRLVRSVLTAGSLETLVLAAPRPLTAGLHGSGDIILLRAKDLTCAAQLLLKAGFAVGPSSRLAPPTRPPPLSGGSGGAWARAGPGERRADLGDLSALPYRVRLEAGPQIAGGIFIEVCVPTTDQQDSESSQEASCCGGLDGGRPGRTVQSVRLRAAPDLDVPCMEEAREDRSGWTELSDSCTVALELCDNDAGLCGYWLFTAGGLFARVVGLPYGTGVAAYCVAKHQLEKLCGSAVHYELRTQYDAVLGKVECPGLLKAIASELRMYLLRRRPLLYIMLASSSFQAMGGEGDGSGAAADAASALVKLRSALQGLAPKLCPSPAPIAHGTPGAALTAELLERLYKGEGARGRLDKLLKTGGSSASCQLCSGALQQPSWSLDWEVDVAKRRMSPSRCQLLCGACAGIRDLPALIKRLSFDQDAAASGSEVLRHFLAVNGHDAAEAHLLQDAVSVAHAMLVIQKELRLALARGPPLQELLGDSGDSNDSKGSLAGKRGRDESEVDGKVVSGTKNKKVKKKA
ncbi:unnamed protein product [Polarella glacialis]|uniref:Uncharacterized protein n=1 Tax=Polarella glacialis TaxID=89957 RepID=A0A813I0R1_POLGL|nr:unnamed protein product [Polarella glacialis]